MLLMCCWHHGQKPTISFCWWFENQPISSGVGTTLFPNMIDRSSVENTSRNLQSFDYCGVICSSYHPVWSYSILSVRNLSKDMVAIYMRWKELIRIQPDMLSIDGRCNYDKTSYSQQSTELSDVQTFFIDWHASQQILSCHAHNIMHWHPRSSHKSRQASADLVAACQARNRPSCSVITLPRKNVFTLVTNLTIILLRLLCGG